MMPLINIVILNWNGAEDTIECLESLQNLTGVNYRVTLCDNASSGDDLQQIFSWAQANEVNYEFMRSGSEASAPFADLTLIQNGANLGFAGGNNRGITFALQQDDVVYVWLLNNDTVVEPNALSSLVRRCEADPQIGICGSLLKFYDNRSVIQAVGGCSFNPMTGIASQTLGRYLPDTTVLDRNHYEARQDYVCGASMLVSRSFLEQIGLMEESYFLYYEEMDWAIRAEGKFKLAIALESVVYHKEGSAIGSASMQEPASPSADFYLTRAKLRFMARHFVAKLPVAYLCSMLQVLNRFRRGQWQTGAAMLRAILGLPMANTVS